MSIKIKSNKCNSLERYVKNKITLLQEVVPRNVSCFYFYLF